jgi:DNA-directed RNA polymerase specialized sigma24 family protein
MARPVRYHEVVFRRLPRGVWTASVATIPGCVVNGRTVDEARRRIVRKVQQMLPGDWQSLVERVEMPNRIEAMVRSSRELRARAQEARDEARDSTIQAIALLAKLGLSSRDAAELLGLSHQRVHQLSQRAPTARRAKGARVV